MFDYDLDLDSAEPPLLGLGVSAWLVLGLASVLLWSSIAVWIWRMVG